MSIIVKHEYCRPQAEELHRRLREPRRYIQVIAGSRQTGKTTLVRQLLHTQDIPTVYASADEPTLKGPEWIVQQWEAARLQARGDRSRGDCSRGAILALDEIQKIPGWSETVKRLWDEDTAAGVPLQVVVLGSAPLPVRHGLTESLTGRFEVLPLPHWSYTEMQTAFGFDLEQFLFFGGYPGGAPLIDTPQRWIRYIRDSLIETTISRDVLLLTRVDKPALLRRLFEFACLYSGRIVSYTKMLGQLHDVGNTTTLAHYLDLLAGAGMVMGLQKYSGSALRRRGSSPKLQVLNTALMTAQSGLDPPEAMSDPEFRGRLIESAVGAHLARATITGIGELYYWRERNREVDFVTRMGRMVTAIEVKSGRTPYNLPGIRAFSDTFGPSRTLLVGGDGIPLEEFLAKPAEDWIT